MLTKKCDRLVVIRDDDGYEVEVAQVSILLPAIRTVYTELYKCRSDACWGLCVMAPEIGCSVRFSIQRVEPVTGSHVDRPIQN